jgi:aryl-alcohol dehydrogenase-like predicted oxidoreductase
MLFWSTFLTELNTTVSALALAWVARNPNTSTVILGASSKEQLLANLKAVEVMPKLTPEVLGKIEAILGNKPSEIVSAELNGFWIRH